MLFSNKINLGSAFGVHNKCWVYSSVFAITYDIGTVKPVDRERVLDQKFCSEYTIVP